MTNGGSAGTSSDAGDASSVVDCGLPAAGGPSLDGGAFAPVAKPSGTPGNLKVLNWAGFKGAVTYTFDDANSSQLTNYAALNGLGVRMTFYLITSKIDSTNRDSWAQVLKDGHELGNHTVTHPQTGTALEVDGATNFIENTFGVRPWTMAAPYGDGSYVTLATTRFLINRGVSPALILPNDNSNPFNLPCYIPPQGGTSVTDFNPIIDSAESGGGWRVVLVHGFTGGTDGAFQPVSIDEFVAGANHAKGFGNLWIDSMVNVGAYWRGQKTFSGVSPTTSGNSTTWTWTLPDNFPPGKCLRVNVDGGTLTQNGTALNWDSHGYYEISLDTGSLTLSP
jgi:peptidoglycan/xylan/chitin deacetylase (PgdA/CDA1 family)